MQHHAVVPVFGSRFLPVFPGHVGDAVLAFVLIEIEIGIAELVGNVHAGSRRGGVGLCVQGIGHGLGDQLRVAVGVHAASRIFHRVAFPGQEIVDCIVGVFGCGQVIIALGDYIRAGIVGIVGSELPLLHRDGEGLALTRLQHIGLVEGNQFRRGRLHVILLVILSVGFLQIDLHCLLAGGAAGVGHRDADLIDRLRAGGVLGHRKAGVGKVCIGKSVAEGIGHRPGIVIVAGIGRTHDEILIAALGVAVSQVDALLIHHIIFVLLGRTVGVDGIGGSLVDRGSEVGQAGVLVVGAPEGGAQPAGRIHIAGQDLGNGIETGLAGRADPQRCVNAVGGIIQEVGLHLVGKVQDDDHLFKGSCILGCLDPLQKFHLLGREFQVIALGGISRRAVHIVQGAQGAVAPRHVAALAAHTGKHHNGRVPILGKAGAVGRLHLTPGSLANDLDAGNAGAGLAHHTLVAGLFLGGIPVPQGIVDGKVAVSLQRRLEGGSGGGVHRAGTRAAIDRIHTADAKQADLALTGRQGQGAVVIFQQHGAFCHGLLAQGTACGDQFFQVVEPGLEILGVLCSIAGIDGAEGRGIQHAVDLRGVLPCNYTARHADAAQYRHHQGQRFAQTRYRAHRGEGRNDIDDESCQIQDQGDKEVHFPGGVDSHKGRRDVGVHPVQVKQEGDKLGSRQYRRSPMGFPEGKQCHSDRQSDSHGPNGLPGYAVHTALYRTVQQNIGDHPHQRQPCAQDCELDRAVLE